MMWPLPVTLALVGLLGVCIGVLVHYYLTLRPSAPMTRMAKPADYWLAECLECGARFRNQDPLEAQAWAYTHHHDMHGAR